MSEIEREAMEYDVVIVGAGPAGFAATLQAKKEGLRVATIDRQDLGGTIRKYPRRKLTLTGSLSLPLHGTLDKEEYLKEELIQLFEGIARRHGVQVSTGLELTSIDGQRDAFTLRTNQGAIRSRRVLLAMGRRGIPRRLGVPGEDAEKVLYQLVDAASINDEKILVVGGGDSAIEAALALSEQRGNQVTISYRRADFFRLKSRNDQRLRDAVGRGRLALLLESEVTEIGPTSVTFKIREQGIVRKKAISNDTVYIMAGGEPPFELLKKAGVAFGGDGPTLSIPADPTVGATR